jgi:glycosyltransferase involved in cell wall biosynthesis
LFTTQKIAIVSVINDLVTDNRVNKTCLTLRSCGYDVILIGRKLPGSLPLPDWPFKSHRLRLWFRKGPLFYLFFNLRLFFQLLFRKSHLLYANDLDTLLPNYLVARLKGVPLIYDSHELFCEVPELQQSPVKRKIWLKLEGLIVPKLKTCITVNDSIARLFGEKYHVRFESVRNISDPVPGFLPKTREALDLPAGKKIILLQGAGINVDRGAEELIDAMAFVENCLLLIIGGGDVWEVLQEKVRKQDLSAKVRLISKIPRQELMHYTYNADLALSVDKNTNLNYYYSLPNKIFDYIHAGVPILASDLPEIRQIIASYEIGEFISDHSPVHIAGRINDLLSSDRLFAYRRHMARAQRELNWSAEQQKLRRIILSAGRPG